MMGSRWQTEFFLTSAPQPTTENTPGLPQMARRYRL
ncbi:hypothetical protein BST61_g8054 [Cercospora zeina]